MEIYRFFMDGAEFSFLSGIQNYHENAPFIEQQQSYHLQTKY